MNLQRSLCKMLKSTLFSVDGVDAGGLAKDWFQQFMRKLTEGPTGLLKASSNGVHIDPRASAIHGGDVRWIFRSIGILIAKVFYTLQIPENFHNLDNTRL